MNTPTIKAPPDWRSRPDIVPVHLYARLTPIHEREVGAQVANADGSPVTGRELLSDPSVIIVARVVS